jgi:hypothetical protein
MGRRRRAPPRLTLTAQAQAYLRDPSMPSQVRQAILFSLKGGKLPAEICDVCGEDGPWLVLLVDEALLHAMPGAGGTRLVARCAAHCAAAEGETR